MWLLHFVAILVGETRNWVPELLERAKKLKVSGGFEEKTDVYVTAIVNFSPSTYLVLGDRSFLLQQKSEQLDLSVPPKAKAVMFCWMGAAGWCPIILTVISLGPRWLMQILRCSVTSRCSTPVYVHIILNVIGRRFSLQSWFYYMPILSTRLSTSSITTDTGTELRFIHSPVRLHANSKRT